jgi:hypothetical protein
MKLYNNDTVFDNSNTPEQRFPINSRLLAIALIAIPCLSIVLGLFIDALLNIANTGLTYLILVIPAMLIASNRLLLKNNASPLRTASTFMLKSYEGSIAGLDERERQVIDQAYRMSYRIVAFTSCLILTIILMNITSWHLTYSIGVLGIICIIFGLVDLLCYLPTAIVIWKEEA